uniref:Uncharacterized protein n=1 Tax=Salvator merianae TaxID=96440 RepID=A0A8D0BW39_SALMN
RTLSVEIRFPEATCSVCLDYFKDPVMIPECGHNLCRGCLDQCCGEAAEGTCPQCRLTFRRGNIGPNRQLANMVEMVRKLTLRGAEGEQERVCEQHQKPKHLFCWDDKTLICVTCERKDHKGHETLLLEDAAQKYVVGNQYLFHFSVLLSISLIQEQIKTDREKTMKVFRQLHQFLDEEEKCWLAEMDDIVKEAIEIHNYLDCPTPLKSSHLSCLPAELSAFLKTHYEVSCDEPASEFRAYAAGFYRSLVQTPCPDDYKIKQILSIFLLCLPDFSFPQSPTANISLDPDTAHPSLIVSPDLKSVRWTETPQKVPDNPKRFNLFPCVLGVEEFTAGRHFWEVFVGDKNNNWFVGVAGKTVKRQRGTPFWATEGIWCMGKWKGMYRAFTTFLTLIEEPSKIRVTLNCEDGQIAFYDAERGTLICKFPKVQTLLCP